MINTNGTITASTTGNTDTYGRLENNSGNYIAANGDSGSGENFLITRELNPGTYYIAVGSSKETGKYSLRVDFTEVIKLPDLAVDSVSVDKRSVMAGETIRVNLRRSNKGEKNSGSFDHGIYLSKDRTVSSSDRQLASLARTSMNAGASRTFSQEVAIPQNTTPGTYYLGYILDSERQVEETDETNNTGFAAITIVEPISSDDHGDTRGTATRVTLNRSVSGNLETIGDVDYFRFANTSTGTITAFTTGYTDTYGSLRNNSGNLIENNDHGGFGKNFLITRELNPGTYYIAVGSSKETGIYSLRVDFTEVIKLPDLVVDSVSVDKRSVVAGGKIRVDFDASNKGNVDSGIFTDGLYLSANKIITAGDVLLVDFEDTSIKAGDTERYFFEELIIPENTAPGTYYIGYIIDSGDWVQESNETNNTGYAVITIEPVSNNYGDLILKGSGIIAGEGLKHPNGIIFNQVLLTGKSIKLKAKPSQITRVSFMDEDEDIVQVEFSGAGTFTVTLDPATFLPAALPPGYNQSVEYVTGKPSVVIDGADANTFFSIFTVGSINAVNQALFPEGQVYDAQADVTLVEVVNSTGMGGMQLSNAAFSGNIGKVGVDARGVAIAVRLTVGDIDADGNAVPHLLFGKGSFTVPAYNPGLRITGGDLKQTNSASIVVAESGSTTPGFETLISQNNFKSDGTPQPTQSINATFVNEDGVVIPVTVESR